MKNDRRLNRAAYLQLQRKVLERDNWRCQFCGARDQLQVHHLQSRAQLGADVEENLITLCNRCHENVHRSSCAFGKHHFITCPES
jgi:5-methylcytosine-specific restriction endonuclease McrA